MANQEKVEQAVYQLLEALGENPEREGLLDTPKRVAKMYAEMFSGLNEDPKDRLQLSSQKYMTKLSLSRIFLFTLCVSIIWFLLWKGSCSLSAKWG
ncbi:MAG: GTP cyclohydrolase I [Streptococcus sp.]